MGRNVHSARLAVLFLSYCGFRPNSVGPGLGTGHEKHVGGSSGAAGECSGWSGKAETEDKNVPGETECWSKLQTFLSPSVRLPLLVLFSHTLTLPLYFLIVHFLAPQLFPSAEDPAH